MFSSWGDIAYRRRRIIPVIVIGAILALFAVFGQQLGDRMSQEGWDDPNSQSTRAAKIEQEVFGRDDSGDVILLVSGDSPGSATAPEVRKEMNSRLRDLAEKYPEQIARVNSYFDHELAAMANDDGSAAFATISLAGVEDEVLKNFRVIEDDLNALRDNATKAFGSNEHPAKVEVAGATAVAGALDHGMAGDIKRAEIYALPAVGLLLLIVFGGVIAAGMPLLVGVLSILGSLGVLAVLASFTQINVFAQSVVTLLGLGLAIDYGLFMVSRFREELAEGNDVPTAVRNTTATAGKTVVFSAAMVAVALSGLLIFPQAFLKSVAFGAISAVGLAALLSVAVLPSIFAMLGHRIDKWSVRKAARRRDAVVDGVWGAIPSFAMRHSKKIVVFFVGGLIAAAIPIAGIKLGGINETYLPPNETTRVSQDHFNDEFPNYRTDPVKLVITGDNAAVGQVYQQANQVEGLVKGFTVSQPTKDGVTVLSGSIADRDDYQRIVRELEDLDVDNAEVLVAGTPALEAESIQALLMKLPIMLGYIVLVSFVLMALIFGSVIIPAKAIIMNILGTGATLSLLTLIFVNGVGADLFNFTPGPLTSPVLVLIVAIIFGLSTDYEVFLVSRMVEARNRGMTTDQAIRFGTAATGNIITAAALIMIVVCGAFGFSSIVMMKYIAFGMVIALILDATIIRMLLVPAVMHLLRGDNWWAPRWVKTLSEKVGHNENLEGTSAPVPNEWPVVTAQPREPKQPIAESLPAADAGVEHDDVFEPDVDIAEPEDGFIEPGVEPVEPDVPEPAPSHERNLPFHELMARLDQERNAQNNR